MTTIEPTAPATSGIEMINRADIRAWKEQPRKHFDVELVGQLARVMHYRGFSPAWPLLVRPSGNGYEIADGERRWRAAALAGIEEIPCVVQVLDDAQMLELAMISSLHKKDLSPMEEAAGIKRMLDIRDAAGEPVHTVASLAKTLHISERTVGRALALHRLAGSPVGVAVDAGDITVGHAVLIARIPTAATREKVLAMVLKPMGCAGPMPVSELEKRLVLDYVCELRGAPFDLKDADLVPVVLERGERVSGGACVDCPSNMAGEGARKAQMCMSPECYRAKEAAVHARWVEEKRVEGKTALSHAENAKVFGSDGVKLSVTTDFVDLDEKPDRADLGAKTDDLPTWGKLVKGAEVPVVVARDGKGRERALVNRKLAVAAVEQLDATQPPEKQILEAAKKAPSAPRLTPDEEKARVLAQKEQQEREARLGKAEIAAIVSAARLPLAKVSDEWLGVLLSTLGIGLGLESLQQLCVARGWVAKGVDVYFENFLDFIDGLPQHECISLITEISLIQADEFFRDNWAHALGVDLKKVRKDEEAKMKAEAKAAKEASKTARLKWETEKTEAADFVFDEYGICRNPDVAKLDALPHERKAQICVARKEDGWHYGFEVIDLTGRKDSREYWNGATYSTRELAARSALLGIRNALEQSFEVPEVLAKVDAYLASLKKGGKGK